MNAKRGDLLLHQLPAQFLRVRDISKRHSLGTIFMTCFEICRVLHPGDGILQRLLEGGYSFWIRFCVIAPHSVELKAPLSALISGGPSPFVMSTAMTHVLVAKL